MRFWILDAGYSILDARYLIYERRATFFYGGRVGPKIVDCGLTVRRY